MDKVWVALLGKWTEYIFSLSQTKNHLRTGDYECLGPRGVRGAGVASDARIAEAGHICFSEF